MEKSMKGKGTIYRYYDLEDFEAEIKKDEIWVGDELVTEDIDGKAIFQVADVRKKYVYMIRKFALADERPMDGLPEWLNREYYDSLPAGLRAMISPRKGEDVFLPKEVEVFGEHHYSPEAEKGRQWELFKKRKQRIRLFQNKYGKPAYWWESSPFVSTSTHF